MRRTAALCIALLVVVNAHGVAAQGREVTSASLQQFLDPLVTSQLEQRKIAGAVITIVNDGVVIFSKGYGQADMIAGRAMGPETIVRIASITKTFTALAVMQLVERGALDLDRDVSSYLDFTVPAMPGRAPVTLRRLLSHQAGFENRSGSIGGWTNERPLLGPYLARHMPPRLSQSDDIVAYSNFNAALAAYIVERASGQPFEQYLSDHIFTPLQMARTTAVQPLPATFLPDVSNGYVRSDLPPTPESMATATIFEVGSTGVSTTGTDMGRLMLALLDGTSRVVSPASLTTMMTGQTRIPRGVVGLGLFSPVGAGGNAFIGHDGGTGGFVSTLALLPQERFGLFASYNSPGISGSVLPPYEIATRIADHYFADVRLPSKAGRPVDVAGVYEVTRRVESNVFKLQGLLNQVAVRLSDNTIAIRPVIVPFGEPVTALEPGIFRWRQRDVWFQGSGPSAVMYIGSPSGPLIRVPWWARADLVVPTIAICLIVAAVAILRWPLVLLRRRTETDRVTTRLKSATRLAMLFDLVAIGGACWLVFWGWPLAALSSPVVPPLGVGIYTAAWAGVLLTPFVAWSAFRSPRRDAPLLVVHVMLIGFCLYWHIAGTTLAF